jgi:phage tail-like protein
MPASDVDFLGGSPPVASNFVLEVDGSPIGMFGSVKGLQVSVKVESYVEGGVTGFVHQFPGQMEWPNLVFSCGLTNADNLFTWMNRSAGNGFQAEGGKLERKNGSVVLLDHAGKELRRYSFEDAFPVRWSGPALDVNTGTALTEELEIAHHGFRSSATS